MVSYAFGGLIALRSWLRRSSHPGRKVDLSVWGRGAEEVARARGEMEASFRRLSDGLELLLAANENCVKRARLSVAAGLGNISEKSKDTVSYLVEAAELCRRVLRFSEKGAEAAGTIRDDLDELARMSRKIHLMEGHIEDHMRPAEVVQVMLRIECARLDEAARAPLEALSAEIARTCEKMNRTMEAEFQLVEETHQTVSAMIDHVRKLEVRQRQAEKRRDELSAEMDELRDRALEQAERDQTLSLIAAKLDKAVAGVIEAMQYQDIVGQRWEHVQHGFERIAAGEGSQGETGFDATVQQAQLVEANAEMAAALVRIDESIEGVAEAKARLNAEIESMLADTRRQQMNVRMHAVLFEVWDMIRTNEDEMKGIDLLIAPLVQVAGKLGVQIGGVSHEMRMIALNAQIQAARFGSSTGLEVLAESLRRIADLMGESGETLDGDSRQIEQIAGDLRMCFAELQEQARTVSAECDRDFPATIDQLSTQEESCNRLLREAVESLEGLETVRGQMRMTLEGAVRPLEHLGELAQTCGDFVEEHYRGDESLKAYMREQTLAVESSRYTMAAEKEVLLKVAGQNGSAEAELEQPANGELDLF